MVLFGGKKIPPISQHALIWRHIEKVRPQGLRAERGWRKLRGPILHKTCPKTDVTGEVGTFDPDIYPDIHN